MRYVILLLVLALTGCRQEGQPAQKVEAANQNSDFRVEYLFQVDGCTIYRFYDAGRGRYFSKCKYSSEVQSTYIQSTGKSTTTYDESVPTVYEVEK